MKLKIKKTEISAGRPIAFLPWKTSAKLNVKPGDRIEISQPHSKKIIATIDIMKNLPDSEIVLSKKILLLLKKPFGYVEVSPAITTKSTKYIAKKLHGKKLSKKEIFSIIEDIVSNRLTEAEIAYFVSGVYHNGFSFEETRDLTKAMFLTGKNLSWRSGKIADKHSIGGIPGNRTTPIVVSILACLGIKTPKTSSRAITSAAGTADVMEILCHVSLTTEELKSCVNKTNACLAWGGSLNLAPSDDKLIQVERLLNLDPEAQLLASIMSKKLSVGSKYVLIDIPYGKYAKVSLSEAKKLGKKFHKLGKSFKLKIKVVLTPGNEPIGNGIGPFLEAQDVLKVLNQSSDRPLDLEEKSLFLASELLQLCNGFSKKKSDSLVSDCLISGKALKKFNQIISCQGKKPKLKPAQFKYALKSKSNKKIKEINNKELSHLARILGCPSEKTSGIFLHHHINSIIEKNEPILTLYSESKAKLSHAKKYLLENEIIKFN
jgi:putative thymidine phosphorylase